MTEESLLAMSPRSGGEIGAQIDPIHIRVRNIGDAENGSGEIDDGDDVVLDRAAANRELLLEGIRGIFFSPSYKKRNVVAAFIAVRFFTTNRIIVKGVAGNLIPAAESWRVTPIVADEDNQGIFGHSDGFEMRPNLAERSINPFHHGGEASMAGAHAITVISGGVGISGKGSVDSVIRHIGEKGHTVIGGLRYGVVHGFGESDS